jgi:hypothetical protein
MNSRPAVWLVPLTGRYGQTRRLSVSSRLSIFPKGWHCHGFFRLEAPPSYNGFPLAGGSHCAVGVRVDRCILAT